MPSRPWILLLLVLCIAPAAQAVQPLRILGASFEPDDPQRDCAADATTELALAEAVRGPGGGFCVPPFIVGNTQVCIGASSQCESAGCFVPLGASTASSVDAIAGRITLADPLGTVAARIDNPIFAACTANFTLVGASIVLDYASANDGLDGVVLGELATPPTADLVTTTSVGGCPAYASELPQITAMLRGFVLQGYVAATVTRIGEPLDAVVCPIVRP
jgi:hypothetical protein